MAKLDPTQNAYYPSPQKTGDLHNDFRLLFAHMYESKRQIADLQAQLATAHSRIGEMQAAHASAIAKLQEPANTKMLGLRVRPTDLADGQKLTYVAATGDFRFL